MRKKRRQLILVFMVVVGLSFSCVEASNSEALPEACNGPSEMMGYYFEFQKEAKSILLGSDVNSRRYSTSFGTGGLFASRTLDLHITSSIDLLANGMRGKTKSIISNTITSAVLLLMVSASVVQSNVEGFGILFTDYPIVRDYKEMLDIESELFNVAYFRSKEINLTRPFESDLLNEFNELIKQYQKIGLLETGSYIKGDESMADIIMDLNAMNAAMKQFIMIGGEVGKNGLKNYNGCLGNQSSENCNKNVSILKFSVDAVDRLYMDYKEVRKFGKCSAYWHTAKNKMNGILGKNKESLKSSMKEIKSAMERLKSALFGKNNGEKKENRCDLSEYEMAQVQAYRGGNWTCNQGLVSVEESITSDTRDSSKKAQKDQKQKTTGGLKNAKKKDTAGTLNIQDGLKGKGSNSDRQQTYKIMVGSGIFNPEFSFDMNDRFGEVYDEILSEIWQSQENAMSVDISDLLPKSKGILDEVDVVIKLMGQLETHLQKIEDKQCTG